MIELHRGDVLMAVIDRRKDCVCKGFQTIPLEDIYKDHTWAIDKIVRVYAVSKRLLEDRHRNHWAQLDAKRMIFSSRTTKLAKSFGVVDSETYRNAVKTAKV